MKTLLVALLGLALVLVIAPAIADENHVTEKKASDEIDFGMTVKIGDYALPAGKYRISCNRKELKFTRLLNGKETVLPCRGKELAAKSATTEIYMTKENGIYRAEKLLLRGSTVEHVF